MEFPSLMDADFLENDEPNAEFSSSLMDLRILHLLSCKKRSGHIFVFLVSTSTTRIFSKLCARILTATLLFPPERMKMSNNTDLCHHFDRDAELSTPVDDSHLHLQL